MPRIPLIPPADMAVMSFGEHLEELRTRLLRSIAVVAVATVIALFFMNPLMRLLSRPHRLAMAAIGQRREALLFEDEAHRTLDVLKEVPAGAGRVLAARLDEATSEAAEWARLLRGLSGESPTVRAAIDHLHGLIAANSESVREANLLGRLRARLERLIEHTTTTLDTASSGARPVLERGVQSLRKMLGVTAAWRSAEPDPSQVMAARAPLEEALGHLDGETGRLIRIQRLQAGEDTRPLILLSYTESFFSHIKVCVLAGLLFGLPWLTLEIWAFVAAGLYPQERRAVTPFIPFSLTFMALGITFAYLVLLPVGLRYLGGFGSMEILQTSFTLRDYLSLVIALMLGMGLVFQLPLLMVFASRAGIVETSSFRKYRRIFIVGAAIIGALLTPPDVVTQLLMAGPLILLYESGIWASDLFARRARKAALTASQDEGREA